LSCRLPKRGSGGVPGSVLLVAAGLAGAHWAIQPDEAGSATGSARRPMAADHTQALNPCPALADYRGIPGPVRPEKLACALQPCAMDAHSRPNYLSSSRLSDALDRGALRSGDSTAPSAASAAASHRRCCGCCRSGGSGGGGGCSRACRSRSRCRRRHRRCHHGRLHRHGLN